MDWKVSAKRGFLVSRNLQTERGKQISVMIDGGRRTVIPGLNDSHMHPIRGGLNYNLELRWDGVPSLAEALRMLKEQAARTPAPQWVRVVGGWTEFQFAERRMPTLDEINAAAPDTPVFVMHLYDRALLNGAALRAVGYDKNAPDFPAGEVQRDRHGNPTGLLIAKPNANILYACLSGFDGGTPGHVFRTANALAASPTWAKGSIGARTSGSVATTSSTWASGTRR